MNFAKTSAEDFTIIKNGVDDRLEIIRHDETGYYNITKVAKLVQDLKSKEGVDRKPDQPKKRGKLVGHWNENNRTTELKAEVQSRLGVESIEFELKEGTDNDYKGTYVHRYLYDHFLMWLDPKYAFRVSHILDNIHKEANRKILKEKDDKIDELIREMKIQTVEMNELKQMNMELLINSQKTLNKLDDVSDELTETKETVQVAKSYLEEKSFTSTMNPENEQLHHYFAATETANEHQTEVKFVTGHKGYVEKQVLRHRTDSDGELAIEPFYIANGIDLRNNMFEEFKQRRREVIKQVNTANAIADKEFNDELKIEIREYNKVNSPKRVFSQEKQVTPKIGPKHISVEFKKTKFIYTANPYMTFDDIIQIVKDVHNITQASPMKTDK